MKPKAYIFAGLAIVCGLGASYMTSRLLADRTQDEPEKVEILVAKRNLNVGERINKPEDMFEMKAVVKENEPPDAVKDFDVLKGKTLKQTRNKGDHITTANLYDRDQIDIPEGHVAVSMPINLANSGSGLATLPGSRVNLILTAPNQDPRRASARVLMQNVLVLAADGRVEREGDRTAPASVVTFALTPKDALKVKLAETMGGISLSLRKLNEPVVEQPDVITGADVFTDKKKEEPAAVIPTPAPEKVVEVKPEVKPEPVRDIRSILIINGVQPQQHLYEVRDNQTVDPNLQQSIDAPPAPNTPAGRGQR